MRNTRQMIPAAGLVGTVAMSVYMVLRLNAQAAPPTADFTNAAVAEVRDAQGQVVLSGEFQAPEAEDDDEVERKAVLTPTRADAGGKGEAEIEFSRKTPSTQEVEFSVSNLTPGAAFTFVIDGAEVGAATADDRGAAGLEIEVRRPAGAAPR